MPQLPLLSLPLMSKNNNRRFRFLTWFRLAFLGVGAVAAGSLYTPYPARLVQLLRRPPEPKVIIKVVEVPVEKPETEASTAAPQPATPAAPPVVAEPWKPETVFRMPSVNLPPFPPVMPEKVELGRFEQLASIANGISLKSLVEFKKGTTASADRKKKEAYQLHVDLQLATPQAADGAALAAVNPRLPAIFPAYGELMTAAKVSPWFHSLYHHKQTQVRKSTASLGKILDRHNYFDTDTILEIKAPQSGRRVLWMQADMDVVSDGSDGDRLPTMPEKVLKSDYYQPTTSYRWKKTGQAKNPLLPRWESKLEALKKDKSASKSAVEDARAVVNDLKRYSFLLAEYDPFIVIPLTFKEGSNDAFRPRPGDYAAVVVGDRVFPALVGDYGPRYKTGEGSLRLAKLINPKATSYARPVSDLTVSYLIFPGSADAIPHAPDYERLNSRVLELLQEIGGLSGEAKYQKVEDLLAPKEDAGKPSAPSETAR